MSVTVQSNVVKVLKEMMVQVQTLIPTVKIVYDGDLSYESAVEKLRAANNQNQSNPSPTSHAFFPLLAFNRTPLRMADILLGERGAKMIGKSLVTPQNNDPQTYKQWYFAQGTIQLQFVYYVNNIDVGEQFEIMYLAEKGISGIEKIGVDLGGDLGIQYYSLNWSELEEFTINNSNAYYASYSGTANIWGNWFMSDSASLNVIKTINTDIKGSNSELLETIVIS